MSNDFIQCGNLHILKSEVLAFDAMELPETRAETRGRWPFRRTVYVKTGKTIPFIKGFFKNGTAFTLNGCTADQFLAKLDGR